MERKICCVVQRYGLEVNGGAEFHCREISEQLAAHYDVEVLTTKAKDYMTWRDEYTASEEILNGVRIRRFSVEKERNVCAFNEINARFMQGELAVGDEMEWMEAQGPYVPELIRYIDEHKDDYDVFIFFTYLYYQTAIGMRVVKDKAIIVPDAHDEPFLTMRIFDPVFKSPKAMFFNTNDERTLVRKRYHNWHVRCRIGGAGVNLPEAVLAQRFKEKYKVHKYIVYVGRIDEGKNCRQLFKDFMEYKRRHGGDLKLVLMGKNIISIPEHPDILALGFVDEEDKFDGICGAEFLVLPSQFESLSIVVLEAFSLQIPVLVNGSCEVLKTHCKRSNAGLYYYDTEGFCETVNYLMEHPKVRKTMGISGKRYVDKYYRWDMVIHKLESLIQYVAKNN